MNTMNVVSACTASATLRLIFMFGAVLTFRSSHFPGSVVRTFQASAQAQHRIALAGEQRVDAYADLGSHLLEAPALQLVPNEYPTLILGQFVDCPRELLEEHAAGEDRLRSGI